MNSRLRLARQARGFSQQQLASMAGVSRQAVSAVESGQSDPSLRVALFLARALGMTVDELFGPEVSVPAVWARLVPAGLGLPADGAAQGSPAGGAAGHGGPQVPSDWAPGAGSAGSERSRVTLAPIGDSFVAFPLTGPAASREGFRPAGGLVVGASAKRTGGQRAPLADAGPDRPVMPGPEGSAVPGPDRPVMPGPERSAKPGLAQAGAGAGLLAIQPIGPPRPTLVVAGCDPALPLLEAPLSLLEPPVAFSWWPCPSQEALRLAADGLVHVAGAHLRGRSGGYNTGPASELLPGGGEVIGFSAWQEGLVLRPDLADGVAGVADVVRGGLRLVNREPGAVARRVLDRELASGGFDPGQVPGYQTTVTGHLQVAGAIAAGLADVGVASEPAALAYGLGFVPLAEERFDLVIPAGQLGTREVDGLLRVLSSPWLAAQLASLPGYDPGRCGEHVATLPAAAP
jgi:molybdate-binding protein/DNA-binding XRE family transcriptional regulator